MPKFNDREGTVETPIKFKTKKLFKFELGQKVQDEVTGFEGTITGRVEYMTGCLQYCIAPKFKENEHKDSQWYDEPRLKLINADKKKYKAVGGPVSCMPVAK